MKKRLVAYLMVSALAVTVLAGCGSKGDAAGDAADAATGEAAVVEEDAFVEEDDAAAALTAAIEESASPRNPRDEIVRSSSTVFNFDVACLKNASLTSSAPIPLPSSVMRIMEIPPSFISIVMRVAPASIAFSVSSFTMEAGRSTTSPAAILSTVF